MSGSDRILIEGLKVFGYHGVTEREAAEGQDFLIDVECRVDLSRAARSDDLADTVAYDSLAREVARIATSERFRLIETLAEHIAVAALARPSVSEVRVRVAKPRAPLDADVRSVAVEIVRRRGRIGDG
ncbi:MAG: dihydroneopterin aldolase [Actinomycetota bacterium]